MVVGGGAGGVHGGPRFRWAGRGLRVVLAAAHGAWRRRPPRAGAVTRATATGCTAAVGRLHGPIGPGEDRLLVYHATPGTAGPDGRHAFPGRPVSAAQNSPCGRRPCRLEDWIRGDAVRVPMPATCGDRPGGGRPGGPVLDRADLVRAGCRLPREPAQAVPVSRARQHQRALQCRLSSPSPGFPAGSRGPPAGHRRVRGLDECSSDDQASRRSRPPVGHESTRGVHRQGTAVLPGAAIPGQRGRGRQQGPPACPRGVAHGLGGGETCGPDWRVIQEASGMVVGSVIRQRAGWSSGSRCRREPVRTTATTAGRCSAACGRWRSPKPASSVDGMTTLPRACPSSACRRAAAVSASA